MRHIPARRAFVLLDSWRFAHLPWTGATWAVDGNGSAYNTPTYGSDLLTNGNMETSSPPSNWTAVGVTATADADVHGGSQALKVVAADGTADRAEQSVTGVVGKIYQLSGFAKRGASYVAQRFTVGNLTGVDQAVTGAAYSRHVRTGRATSTSLVARLYAAIGGGSAGDAAYFDDLTLREITLSSAIASVDAGDNDLEASVIITNSMSGSMAGLMVNLDDAGNPANFVVAYYEGARVFVDKCVGGTYTALFNTTVSYNGSAKLTVKRLASNVYQVFWNNAQIGTNQTVSDAGIIDNTHYALLSTNPANTFAQFKLDGVVVPFAFAPTSIYVAKTGNDSTGDGSAEAPYLTIGKANTVAASDATIVEIKVLTGTYTEIVSVPRDGLTYRAVGAVIVDGAGANKGFYTAGYSNVTIIGFTVTNGAWMFDIRAGSNVRVFNCTASDCLRGFHLAGASRALIENCIVFDSTDSSGGYYLSANSTDCIIRLCEAYNCAGRAFYALTAPRNYFIDCYAHDPAANAYGFEVELNSDDCQYVRCWAVGVGSRFFNGMICKTSLRSRMEGCVVSGVDSVGFYFKNGSSGWAYNCVAHDAYRGFLLADNTGADPSINNTIQNCIIVDNSNRGIQINSGSESGLTLDYNNYYGNAELANYLSDAKTLAGLQALGFEDHGFEVDPGYDNFLRGGFLLSPGNALKNAGVHVGGSDTTPDIGREGSQWTGFYYV